MAFTPQQTRFRFYNDDGTLTTATAAAAEDTNLTITDGAGNKSYQLLIQIQETGGTAGASTDDWQLQYSKNSGAWTNVTTTSSNVKAFDSANLTDAGSIAKGSFRLTAGAGSAATGLISEDGLLDNFALPNSNYTELLYTVQTVDADLAGSDTLDFRLLLNGAVLAGGYTVTPRITNNVATQTLTPSLFTNSQTFYAPTISTSNTLTPSLFTNSQTFYASTISTTYSLTPSLYTNTQSFYSPTVAQSVYIEPSLVTNTQTFYAPVVTTSYSITPSVFTNTQTFYAPGVFSKTLEVAFWTNTSYYLDHILRYEPKWRPERNLEFTLGRRLRLPNRRLK